MAYPNAKFPLPWEPAFERSRAGAIRTAQADAADAIHMQIVKRVFRDALVYDGPVSITVEPPIAADVIDKRNELESALQRHRSQS